MHDEQKDDPAVLEQMKWEKRDLPVEGLGKAIKYFAVFMIASFGISYLFIRLINPDMVQRPETPKMFSPMPAAGTPLVQTSETQRQDLIDLKHKENEAMKSYEWLNEEQGVASIPVERAQELLLEEGFEIRANARSSEDSEE
jgi:hypothetical protein